MKIAVISGASSGIGRELVKIIDRRCKVLDEIWVIARRRDRLEKLQFHLNHPLRIIDMDLSLTENLKKLQELFEKKKPRVFVLAASAGLGKYGLCRDLDPKDAMDMININVRALTALTQMALPYMVRGGRIILMSSSAAFVPQPGFSIYAATKAYVLSYGQSLNAELKKERVHVTVVCPGPVDTEFFQHCGSGKTLSAIKLFFMANPEKVAALAWRDALRKKPVSVYGLAMRLFRTGTKIIPHKVLITGMRLFL